MMSDLAEEEEFQEQMDRIEKLEKGIADIQRQLNEFTAEAEKRGVVLIPKKGEIKA